MLNPLRKYNVHLESKDESIDIYLRYIVAEHVGQAGDKSLSMFPQHDLIVKEITDRGQVSTPSEG